MSRRICVGFGAGCGAVISQRCEIARNRAARRLCVGRRDLAEAARRRPAPATRATHAGFTQNGAAVFEGPSVTQLGGWGSGGGGYAAAMCGRRTSGAPAAASSSPCRPRRRGPRVSPGGALILRGACARRPAHTGNARVPNRAQGEWGTGRGG